MRPTFLDQPRCLKARLPISLRSGGSGWQWNHVHQQPPNTPL